jgi:hypothetical protein
MNRLEGSMSPYLQQHAQNPVHWWPWCEDAFAEARRRDVPILLSVGYSACFGATRRRPPEKWGVCARRPRIHWPLRVVGGQRKPPLDAVSGLSCITSCITADGMNRCGVRLFRLERSNEVGTISPATAAMCHTHAHAA